MKNRIVGILVIVIAGLMGLIIYSFNTALVIVNTACSHGSSCPMWGTIEFQTNLSIGLMIFVVIIGLYLIFFSKEEKIVTKIKTFRQQIEPNKITKENYKKVMGGLSSEERNILSKIIEAQGSVFQSDLVDEKFNKVRVTRILDRLEGKGLVERKRRGMTNIVILKR